MRYKYYTNDAEDEIIRHSWELLTKPMWPEDEIRPFDEFRARQLDNNGNYCQILLCAFNDSSVLCGMIVLHHIKKENIVFCEYLMMKPEVTGVGEGRKFWEYMRDVLKSLHIHHLFLEYDSPVGLDEEGIKRWKWYYRMRVFRVSWKYWQPPYREGFLPKRMALAYDYGLSGVIPSSNFVIEAIKSIYSYVYNLSPCDSMYSRQVDLMKCHVNKWLLDDREAYPW
jgi:hypothetical protein